MSINMQREVLGALEMGQAQGRLNQSIDLSIEIQETLGVWYPVRDVLQLAKLALDHGLTLPERGTEDADRFLVALAEMAEECSRLPGGASPGRQPGVGPAR